MHLLFERCSVFKKSTSLNNIPRLSPMFWLLVVLVVMITCNPCNSTFDCWWILLVKNPRPHRLLLFYCDPHPNHRKLVREDINTIYFFDKELKMSVSLKVILLLTLLMMDRECMSSLTTPCNYNSKDTNESCQFEL